MTRDAGVAEPSDDDQEEPATTSSARGLLVQWANQQDHWIRALVGEVLRSRRALAPEAVDELYARLLVDKDLAPGVATPAPVLELGSTSDDPEETLALVTLDGVSNVNALTPGQSIAFNQGLTVVFGKNGAGKSGYVRVFKQLAAVRGAEQILPNVHAPTPTPLVQRARVTYRLGAVESAVDWAGGEGGVDPLTRIDVFDASVNLLHVDEDLAFIYTPGDLALFRHVHEAIEGVRAKLETAAKAAKPSTNPFLGRFHRESRLYAKVETLGAATDIAELQRLAAVTPDEAATIDGLREAVAALRPESSDARVLNADGELRIVERGIKLCAAIETFDVAAYDSARETAAAASAKYIAATESAFSGDDVPGVLGDAWRAFVAAADTYRSEAGGEAYPAAGDKCLYCRQTLTESALSLLSRYRDYCNNQLRRDRDDRRRDLDDRVAPLLAIDIAPIQTEIERRRALSPDGTLHQAVEQLAVLAETAKAIQSAAQQRAAILPPTAEETAGVRHALQQRADEARALIKTLRGQAEDRKQEFTKRSTGLRELEDRIALRDQLPDVEAHVERARWADKAQRLVPGFRSPLKSLTNVAKQASEELVSQDFEKAFRAECDALRAPPVRLDFPGRKGQAARRKVIGAHRLSEILSEGEQKVIALADFLAEAQLKPAASPVIFDDPVTSLDYERMREVVDRIVRLSTRRQVIVFTHNVWFAVELLNRFDKDNKERCSYYDIAEDGGVCGIVTGGSSPRTDTESSIRTKLNKLITEAKNVTGEAQAALIERGYGHVRAWCEVAVEKVLLAEAVERYKPHIRMTVLEQIKPHALKPAVEIIVPIFERACRFIAAHSQPLETLNVRPSLSDLEKDWRALQDALKAYKDAKS